MKRLLTALGLLALALLLSACASREEPPTPNYLSLMEDAAMSGDTEAGHLAEYARNHQIDETQSGEVKISFDELFLLARLIYAEAGDLRCRFHSRGRRTAGAQPRHPDAFQRRTGVGS